jgi:co-chaperonin GroES (HSP10)
MKNEVGLVLTGIRVLVRLPKIETMSKGGIALPDRVKDNEGKAQVTAVLVDASDDAWECKELKGIERGDVVFFARYAGAGCDWTSNEVPYRVMNATDIIGKFEPEAPGLDSAFRAAQTSRQVYGTADERDAA